MLQTRESEDLVLARIGDMPAKLKLFLPGQ